MSGRNPTLYALLTERLGVNTFPKYNPENVDNVDTTVVKLASNNPNRVAMTIINLSANIIYVSMFNDVSTSKGIRLAANGGSISLNWEYDMSLISNDWFAVATVTNSEVLFIEVVTL